MLEYLHQHWCAYVSHGGLEENSFKDVKKNAAEILKDLQAAVFPWNAGVKKETETDAETDAGNSKMDSETQALIRRYKLWRQKEESKQQ